MINFIRCGRRRSWPKVRRYSGISVKVLKKITYLQVRVTSLRAEIWIQDLPKESRVLNSQPLLSASFYVAPGFHFGEYPINKLVSRNK